MHITQRQAGRTTADARLQSSGIGSTVRKLGLRLGFLLPGLGKVVAAELLRESLDTACAVDKLLLPRKERMTIRANLDLQLGLGRARLESVPAATSNRAIHVFGMNIVLHGRRPQRVVCPQGS